MNLANSIDNDSNNSDEIQFDYHKAPDRHLYQNLVDLYKDNDSGVEIRLNYADEQKFKQKFKKMAMFACM